MTLGALLDYALAKPETLETFPFGPDVLVLKTKEKMFLAIALDTMPLRINAKCDPEKALALREAYQGIIPGYHMDKKHWNTIILDGSVPTPLVHELIDHSYNLVRHSLKKKK